MENVNSKIYRLLTQFTSPMSPLPPKSNVVIGDACTRTAHNIGFGGRGVGMMIKTKAACVLVQAVSRSEPWSDNLV